MLQTDGRNISAYETFLPSLTFINLHQTAVNAEMMTLIYVLTAHSEEGHAVDPICIGFPCVYILLIKTSKYITSFKGKYYCIRLNF